MTEEELYSHLKDNYPHTSSFYTGIIMLISDILALLLSLCTGFFIVNLIATHDIEFRSFINYSVFIPLFLIVFGASGLYPGIMMPSTEQIRKFFFSCFFGFSGISISVFLFDSKNVGIAQKYLLSYSDDIALCCAFALAIPTATVFLPLMRELFKRIICKHKWWSIPVVVYCGSTKSTAVIDRLIASPFLGYKPAVIISEKTEIADKYPDIPFFASDSEIRDVITRFNIKVALLCDYETTITNSLYTRFRYTISFSTTDSPLTNSLQIKDLAGILGFSATNKLSFQMNLAIKRISELIIIFLLLPLWLPVFIILFIAVKLTSPGPAIYKHKRVGKNGKALNCLKFRSMYKDADKMLDKILAENPEMKAQWDKDRKIVNDPRITPFGKFLRRTSLDELPQLINVLFGSMSLIGPRPITDSELVYYGEYADYVFSVKPGISGMWQVSGRSDTGYEERVNFDTYYIQNWSVWLDVWILIKTIAVVLSHKGAY